MFGVSTPQLTPLRLMAVKAVALPEGAATWEAAFMTADSDGKTPKYSAYVHDIFKIMSRWLVLAQSLNLSEQTLASVSAHPAAYHLPADYSLAWTAVTAIDQVQGMMKAFGDQQQNLLAYIALASTGAPQADQLAALQKAAGWAPAVVTELLAGPVKKETVIAAGLAHLQTCFDLMSDLGSNPSLMDEIAALGDAPATNWAQYCNTAVDVMAKTAARYGSQWETIWPALSGILAVHERNALLALVLSQLNAKFPSIKAARNVYEFLLTDVEMGPTTQISYLKEALNAAQLYLQRCRLRLELGVEDMTHIQPAWWDWMMNYRVWQANREIFVYPENYLIPNLRKSVTPEFATLAQALQQSAVTKAYVGSAFRTYIDGFAEVALLKLVDAYRTRINDTDTLFLLARTKTAPYTFNYCNQPDGLPWTPWRKIDLTINSARCTLVYAFSRPFLFWNEIKKNNTSAVAGDGGSVKTTNSTTYTASVMYSFLNQEGKWMQPQTLVQQAVVLFESDDNRAIALKDNSIFEDRFVMNDLAWTSFYAFSVSAANYLPAPANASEAERLVVMYGPAVQNTGVTVDPGDTSPTSDPNAKEFWTNLHDRAEDHNRMVMGQLSGNLPLRPVNVLNLSLEADALINRQEFLLLDPYQANTPLSLIRAVMQTSGGVIQIEHSGQPISDNHLGGGARGLTSSSAASTVNGYSFIGVGISPNQSTAIFRALNTAGVVDGNGNVVLSAMTTLDLNAVLQGITTYNAFGPAQYSAVLQVLFDHIGATELFSSVAVGQSAVAPVEGQPGWFIVSAADEVFLLMPRPKDQGRPMFSTLADGLMISAPPLTPMSAVMSYEGNTPGSIPPAVSADIYVALTSFSLIENGQLSPQATPQHVTLALGNLTLQKKITDVQIPYIYNVLTNAPMLFKDAFVGGKIDASTSAKIYATLQSFSIIDPNGRVDESILTGRNVQLALGNLLLDGTVTQSQIAGIYTVLAQAPKAVALRYVNRGDARGLTITHDFIFDVIRLSTAAVSKVSRELFAGGVDMLLDLKTQQIPVTPVLPFERLNPSTTNLGWPTALDATQVDFDGLYGQYFWEIFYHIPMLVAYSLGANQQFSEAQAWLQHVFDPTRAEDFVSADVIVHETAQAISQQQAAGIIGQLGNHKIGDPSEPILASGRVNPAFVATTDLSFLSAADPSLTSVQVLMTRNILLNYQLHAPASHFWRFRPFRNHTRESLKDMLSDSNPAIKVYNDDPFDPFAIARLRIGAFEKSTLMQYVDNLIAWGDQLFAHDSWESITAAYMLYVYTYDLLGPKPEQVGDCPGADKAMTFDQIKAAYPDGIPQFLIDLEDFISATELGPATEMQGHAFNDLYSYFCVPENSNLVRRWDTIQDRMYKINNSMNIEGVVRALPLFQPPLNPLDLVKAAAAGNNVQAVASSAPQLSPYRFSSALASANSLCATLIELGSSLLSAVEKSDAEGLAVLRNSQEKQILEMITQIRQDRIDELQATLQSLTAAQKGANARLTFYTDLINRGLSDYETTSLAGTEAALAFNLLGSISKTAATVGYAVPQVGSPFAMTYGGVQIGNALNAASGVFEIGAEISNFVATRAATMAGYERRAQEWSLQQQLAQADVDGLTQQIAAGKTQLRSAQQDLAVQMKSISQNATIDAYLTGKFSNRQLYQWMLGRLAAVYFQTYALAMQAARRAEAAYQFEMDSDRTFLTFEYWDNLHKGLAAGEGLRLALNRMDDAYRAGDSRLLEIERTVSLAMTAPDQLLALKTNGQCTFAFPEAMFDYDYPGHYARKIKTISISIPAVVGPYQNIKATLTQTKNSVTTQAKIGVVRYLLGLSQTKPTEGLRENWAQGQSIALSRGVEESGLFVLDFQDLRYLPFENTGAVSEWTLEMPLTTNRFDFEYLSDVIITLRYTARYDGALAQDVRQALGQAPLKGGLYVNGAMQSAAWQAFLVSHEDAAKQTLTLSIDPAQIGNFKSMTYVEVILRLKVATDVQLPSGATFLTLRIGNEPAVTPKLDNGQGATDRLSWDAKKLPQAWNFNFALDDHSIGPLLANGFIDGKKLLNLEVIVLSEAKVF